MRLLLLGLAIAALVFIVTSGHVLFLPLVFAFPLVGFWGAAGAAGGGDDCSGYTRCVPTSEDVTEALRQVEDPELGMDVVELGLIYDVDVRGPSVKVLYSLTSMGCPAGPLIEQDISRVVQEIPEVESVDTELTFDPPWTPERMSDDAKFILGIG